MAYAFATSLRHQAIKLHEVTAARSVLATTPEFRDYSPAFDPVPSASTRRDGWTPDKQRAFIERLGECGVVSIAARAVGMSPKSAYVLRKRPGAESFAAAWDEAAA